MAEFVIAIGTLWIVAHGFMWLCQPNPYKENRKWGAGPTQIKW